MTSILINMENKLTTTKDFIGTVHFGGFYESMHSFAIDCRIASLLGVDEGDLWEHEDYHNFNYRKMESIYSEFYVKFLVWQIEQKYGQEINLEYISANYPKEYNHYTNTIDVGCNYDQVDELLGVMIKDKEFVKHVKRATTSRDGYMPHYDMTDIFSEKYSQRIKLVGVKKCRLVPKLSKSIDYEFAVMVVTSYMAKIDEEFEFENAIEVSSNIDKVYYGEGYTPKSQ